jgi:hypothetical protein
MTEYSIFALTVFWMDRFIHRIFPLSVGGLLFSVLYGTVPDSAALAVVGIASAWAGADVRRGEVMD